MPDPPSGEGPAWFPTSFDPRGSGFPLVCLPYAGGGTAIYHRWRRWLPAGIQLIPICLPGRERRLHASAIDNMARLLDELTPIIQSRVRMPLAIFGHSMGAAIAFELARRLLAADSSAVSVLFVSACSAPHRLRDRGRRYLSDDQLLEMLVRDFSGDSSKSPEELELMRSFLPTIRADMKLFETYSPGPIIPLPVPLVAIGGASDMNVSLEGLESWREWGGMGSTVRTFPGEHFYFQRPSTEETLLKFLVERILQSRDPT